MVLDFKVVLAQYRLLVFTVGERVEELSISHTLGTWMLTIGAAVATPDLLCERWLFSCR